MNGKPTLYLDQYGNHWVVSSVRELHHRIGGARPSKMFIDQTDGSPIHIGYVVGGHWCTAFQRIELPA